MSVHRAAIDKIRNHIAGQGIGITRDSAIADEIVKCIYAKKTFTSESNHSNSVDLAVSYRRGFSEIKTKFPSIFDTNAEILLDPAAIKFIDEQLTDVDIYDKNVDVIGDVYQLLTGDSLKGNEGQFFTPASATTMLLEMANPEPGSVILDPACGSGGFLKSAALHLRSKGASNEEIHKTLIGIEKDAVLNKLCSSRMSLLLDNEFTTTCGDSIAWEALDGHQFPNTNPDLVSADFIFTNPPFGKNIVAGTEQVLREFELAYKWKLNAEMDVFEKTKNLQKKPSVQVLFTERIIALAKDGGEIGLVVPESMISGRSYRHVVQFIAKNTQILACIGLPEVFFKTSGKGGTHTKVCLLLLKKQKVPDPNQHIFMAEAEWCGTDSRGRNIDRDDLPGILGNYLRFRNGKKYRKNKHPGFVIKQGDLNDFCLAPRYYDPRPNQILKSLKKTHNLLKISNLEERGVLEIRTGHEVGKMAYGTGNIPFVRTSEISNWEIKTSHKHGLSEDIFQSYKDKQDVRVGDILMVRDGTYLIGHCAMVTEDIRKIVYQSHLYKIRSLDHDIIDPNLLLAALESEVVKAQIKSKRYTLDIIDTLGHRISELVLPIPKEVRKKKEVIRKVKDAIKFRIKSRKSAKEAIDEIEKSD